MVTFAPASATPSVVVTRPLRLPNRWVEESGGRAKSALATSPPATSTTRRLAAVFTTEPAAVASAWYGPAAAPLDAHEPAGAGGTCRVNVPPGWPSRPGAAP